MTESVTVVFMGDSITDAGRRTDPSGYLGAGYVRRLHEMATASHIPAKIINSGIGGDRIRDLRRRWDQDCLRHTPDVVSVLIGVNDTWRRYDSGEATSAAEFAADYDAILSAATDAGVGKLIVMEPFLVPVTADQHVWRIDDLEAKIDVVRTKAKTYGATLVHLDAAMTRKAHTDGPASVIDDGVHPSAGGHQLIADLWWATGVLR